MRAVCAEARFCPHQQENCFSSADRCFQASRDDELPNTEDSTVDGITQPTSLCNPEGDSPYYIVLSLGL